jgi:hypothetical protein
VGKKSIPSLFFSRVFKINQPAQALGMLRNGESDTGRVSRQQEGEAR